MADDIVKEMFINETAGSTRLAIVENGRLVELYVERPDHQRMVGSIYKGVVENVIPGMQAAFVDIGYSVNAFLPFAEIGNPESLADLTLSDDEIDQAPRKNNYGNNRRPSRASNQRSGRNGRKTAPIKSGIDLTSGQEILVQIIKEPFAGKGPRVTTDIAIPGRLLVLVQNADFIGISKKISDKYEVRRLRKVVESFKPDGFGIIVRTVSEGKNQRVLAKDFENLWRSWKELETRANGQPGPVLLYQDLTTTDSVIRDLLTHDVDKVIIDSKEIHKRLTSYLRDVSPSQVNLVEYYRGKAPIFSNHEIEGQIDKTLQRKVWLKSGGYIVLEHTEAMLVVDVNSGRFIGKSDHEQNSLKINLEAAREVARQLRLRDVGGLIIIDFIDMQEEANKRKIYAELVKELKKDRAKVAVSPISEFGLLEMTRERVRLSLLHSVSDECPTCKGLGRVPSKDAMITTIDSWLRRFRTNHKDRRLIITVHYSLAEYLRETKSQVVKNFMWQHWVWLEIKADDSLRPDDFRVYSKRRKADVTDQV
ncbi:MAG: Rne/Rng family ribonuclease [Fidelibacterota bacterium]|nr:MAG: Rne/Rng family ribonuclease [Candidatus Neomarinimicrobiota bacterium]